MSYRSITSGLGPRLGIFFRRLPGAHLLPWRFLISGAADAADEVPDKIAPRSAVLVRSGDRLTWLVFDCPRHRNERVMLNLSARRRPSWKILDESNLTVYPSVDALHAGGRCHFWVKRGRVKWVKEDVRRMEGSKR